MVAKALATRISPKALRWRLSVARGSLHNSYGGCSVATRVPVDTGIVLRWHSVEGTLQSPSKGLTNGVAQESIGKSRRRDHQNCA